MNENKFPNDDSNRDQGNDKKNGSESFDHRAAQNIEEQLTNENNLKSGANWFYWVAGLSLINTIMIFAGAKWGFAIGLAITQIIDVVAYGFAHTYVTSVPLYLAFLADMVIAGIFVYIGYMARQKKEYAFIAGMALYAVDGSFYFSAVDILGLGVHAVALFFMYRGYQALTKMNKSRAGGTGPMPGGIPQRNV